MNKLGLFYAPIKRDIEAEISAGVYNDEMGQLAVAPKCHYLGLFREKDVRRFKRVAMKDGKRLVRDDDERPCRTEDGFYFSYYVEWD